MLGIAFLKDDRTFENMNDGISQCVKCGKSLVILPYDRRHGLCFECLAKEKQEI